jgi:hypothetical protein
LAFLNHFRAVLFGRRIFGGNRSGHSLPVAHGSQIYAECRGESAALSVAAREDGGRESIGVIFSLFCFWAQE